MPLPDFSAEMGEIEDEKNAAVVEDVAENAEPVEEPMLTEEEIFKKQKREKLLSHLADCRAKSAAKRKALKEEKAKAKRPRGRPRKQPEPEVDLAPHGDGVSVPSTQPTPSTQAPPVITPAPAPASAPTIDYDRIINGVHQKYLSSKEQRKKAKQPVVAAAAAPAPAPVVAPAFDRARFEAQVREDERNRIKTEVERKKNEQLRQRTKDYYSRLPPRSLANNKSWDSYWFEN